MSFPKPVNFIEKSNSKLLNKESFSSSNLGFPYSNLEKLSHKKPIIP
jgi:hypothetical protein